MTIQTRLDLLATHFGGYSQVVKLLSPADLNVIASFCGPISVSSISSVVDPTTASDALDLLELGYAAGTNYFVHNSSYQYLFREQTDRYFGGTAATENLALSAAHGSYYYITFTTVENQPYVVMLWLLREGTTRVKAAQLSAIRASATSREQSSIPFSLFVAVDKPQLVRERQLAILMAKGDWQQPPTIANLYDNPNLVQVGFAATAGRMLTAIEDVWLAVVELTPNAISGGRPVVSAVWKPVSNQGLGTERLLPNPDGLLYIAASGFNRLTFDRQIQQGYQASSLTAVVKFGFGFEVALT